VSAGTPSTPSTPSTHRTPETLAARDAITAAGQAHADAEARGDLQATMSTLVENPLYELLPIGLALEGRDVVRRYYTHLFAYVMPRVVGYTLRSEWTTTEGLGQEYRMRFDAGDGPRSYDIIGILKVGATGLITGERLYAADELLRIFFAPVLAEAFALPGT